MEHLWVELYRPDGLLSGCKGCIHHISCGTDYLKTVRNGRNGITMAHPHLRMLFKPLEERVGRIHCLQICTTILAGIGLLHLSSQCMGDELCTVADTQNWHLADKLRQIDLKRLRVVY